MHDAGPDARECRMLARYLTGSDPSEYVISAYTRGVRSEAFRRGAAASRGDLLLHSIALRGTLMTALADAYARFASPGGLLRRKLALLVAILESAPESADRFEPPADNRVITFLKLVAAGFRFGFTLLAALLLIAPVHLLASAGAGSPVQQDSTP